MIFDFGVWLSLVERCVRDAEVVGSNPITPTNDILINSLRDETARNSGFNFGLTLLFIMSVYFFCKISTKKSGLFNY